MTPKRQTTTNHILAIAPAVYSATPAAITIDMFGYNAATIAIAIGVGGITFTGTNKVDFVLQHSADGVAFAPVPAAFLALDSFAPGTIANGIVRSLTAAHATADVQRLSYIGGLRYLQLVPTFGGTHATGTPMSAEVILTRPFVHQ